MKKILLCLIVFISLNLYPKNNPSLSAPLSSTCAITNSYCYGSNSGSLHIVAVGGQSPYTYSINNGSFQSIIFDTFNLSPGTYNIITKDALGATIFNSVVITEPEILNAAVIISGQNLTANATGGTATYAYWLTMNGSLAANAQTSGTFSNLAPGTYTVSVKDSNGCLVMIDAIIQPPLISAITIAKEVDCISNASLMATTSGGQGPYVYSINGGTTYQAANIFNNLSSGTYTITVKDSQNTIINTKPIIIAPFAPVNGVALITTPVDCSNNSSITVFATAGQAPYNYSFDAGVTYTADNTFYNVPAGNYLCFVRDQNHCVSPAIPITVEYNPTLKATASSGTLLCTKDKTNLTVTAAGGKSPYQYSLDDNPYTPNDTYTNVGFGSYGLTIKDANDCLIKVSHTVVEPEPILADFIIDEQTLTINGKGGIAPYQFSVDSTSYQSNNVFNNLSFGNHKILIKDSKGCESNIFSASIKAYSPLTNLITLTKKLDCSSNAEITITTSGGKAPYSYSLNGNPYQSSNIFSNISAGIYFVIVKDSTNTTSATNTITVNPLIPITAITTTITKPIDCVSNASLKVTAIDGIAPYLYSIDGGNTFVSTPVFENLISGTYAVYVKDSNGCIVTNYTVITPLKSLTATATTMNITCSGSSDGMISIKTAGGQAPYEYSIGNGLQKSNVFNGLSAGSYNVTIKDALSCLIMISVDIVQPTPLNTTIIIKKPIDCVSDAILNVTATGGTPPYLYSIDSGTTFASTPVFSIATAGSYSVFVKDNNGCINTNHITIAPFDPLIATTTSTNINCYGDNTGSITAIVTAGQAPYSYSIGNGFQTSNIFTNLSAGLYNLTIKDALGCYFKTAPITIMQPATPIIAILETKDQTITINTSGGTGIIKYAISPDLNVFTTKNTFTNLSPGIYEIAVQDENGCFITYTTTINAPAPLVNGKSETTIVFKIGQTLADIKLDIPNIKWYLKAIGITSKTSRTTETPLPLNTIIVDGTTYYASQTVNGIESKERLAVTVKSNGSLSTKDFDLASVNYSPNPVKHILTINNTTAIDEIEIFSVSGKSVLSKKINSIHSEIDLSSLSTGVYFLKVKSEGKEKTMKIIKE